MADPSAYNARIAHILRTPLPTAQVTSIQGNAPYKVKESAVKWLNIFHAPPRCFAGPLTRRTTVTEVSLDPNPLVENGRVLTMVCETDVAEEMLDGRRKASNAFIITIMDECVSSAVTTLDFAEGGAGISGVSLTLDTVFHGSAERGARLRFVNKTLSAANGAQSCSCQVWDLTNQQLVATATFVGMQSSLLTALARL
ncbi:hypothetical protein R3P38DRAFT_2882143 [Favolaschia claudopus]|uniref:Thioesterase domain-containing protein n=1 Tax=Favolaschia claudopus TaxID=2862362 RepID=A0AAW0D2U4_9AGAR